jgi:phosphoribosylpyrophosphate synthetase
MRDGVAVGIFRRPHPFPYAVEDNLLAERSDLILFALGATRTTGECVAARLGCTLAPHEERAFEAGEHKARPLLEVAGRDVFVVQSLHGDLAQSANDKLVRLLFFTGALKDAGAARVTAVTPYLAYNRKDRRTKPRDPVNRVETSAKMRSSAARPPSSAAIRLISSFWLIRKRPSVGR